MVDSLPEKAGSLKRPARQQSAPLVDRLPPHSPEAEQGVLGCILLEPKTCMAECLETIKQGEEEFYDLRHQTIYRVMVQMYDANESIDLITLQQKLKDQQMLEQVGGLTYIGTLPDTVPSAANLGYYLGILTEKYEMRRLLNICTDTVSRVYDYTGESHRSLIESHERDVLKLMTVQATREVQIKQAVFHAIRTIETFHEKKGAIGLSTGLADLDAMTCGLHAGDMIIIAGRPSTGKTSLVMQVLDHIAVDQQLPAGVIELEMSAEQLVLRQICSRARVDAQRIRKGYITESDFPKLTMAAGKLAKAPLYIDDTAGQTWPQARAKIRRWHQLYGIKVAGIDYLQRFGSTTNGRGRQESRQQEVAQISKGIKDLAKELGIPIIVAAQLNREMDKTGSKKVRSRKPRMSDLRECGDLEQDADLIGLLWRPNQDNEGEGQIAVEVELVIDKQRNGPTGDIELTFLKQYTRFENAAKEADTDYHE